jgi:hypothetical protein
MSNRTRDLQPLSGLAHHLRELRYHEGSRQGLAVVLIAVYAFLADPLPWLVWLSVPLILAGMAIRLYASGFISKNSELATDGPYALVRHPLYTGNILLVLGFSMANGRWWALPSALLFFWFYYPTAIEYEDRKLARLFGKAWHQWAAAVPALVPALRNVSGLAGGQWSLAKSIRQNGEPAIAAFVLICLALVVHQIV